jgi:hypothetical protein
MKHKNEKQLDCELNCKATANLRNSILDDLTKKDKDLLALLKDEKTDELEDNPKPVS